MKNDRYRAGLVSISFRQNTPEEILEEVKKSGLSCVEWGSDVHAPCRDLERLKKIAELQERYGIECSSYGTYFRLGETPLRELESYITAAKILGTRVLRLWCGKKRGADMTDEERNALFEECRQAAEIAALSDVMLCMECHMMTFTERAEDICELMSAVNSPNFRIYWQPFQYLEIEENLKFARSVKHFVEHIHVFNWKQNERFPLAEAVDVWRAYLKGFSAPRTLLLEFMPDDRIESLSSEASALKQIIGEIK